MVTLKRKRGGFIPPVISTGSVGSRLSLLQHFVFDQTMTQNKENGWERMRADVIMAATRSRQSVQLGQERHPVTDGYGIPCPESAEARDLPKAQKFTALVQKRDQDEAKRRQTSVSAAPPERKVSHNFVSLPVISLANLEIAKARVEKAVKMNRIFCVQGPYPVIRKALWARGWVEQRRHWPSQHRWRRHTGNRRANANDTSDSDSDNKDVEKEQDPDDLLDLMSRLVQNEMVYFYWTNRRDAIEHKSLQKEQIINHFAKAGSFTTKVGLCINLRNLHWYDSVDKDSFFPRCYRLGSQDEKQAFIEDYRRTACTSLLKFIVEREQESMSYNLWRVEGKSKRKKKPPRPVDLSHMINSALKVCQDFLDSLDHSDIDSSLGTPQTLTQEEWAQFIDSYYLLVHCGAEIENSDHFVKCCKTMLQKLREVRPQLDIDGIYNIWIIKPGAQSRGRGIKCFKRLDKILRLVNGSNLYESKWVIQKYLECPLLVHGTKFDVRQWFLVTSWNPLTVWFYKKCYLRFSTQPYSLDTLDSSVHLCNNSIQRHLRPSKKRHPDIPTDNMWSDDQFKTFLSSQGREAQWQAVVVPGMKRAIIHVLQTTQDLIESRKNTFELYGADFMLGNDLHPWLIEVNASPTMAPSSRVTAQLCRAVQEDTLRVILDWRGGHSTNTGDFQLIYRQAAIKVPQYVGLNLCVEGFKIKNPCPPPTLRPSKHSASKQRGPVKQKKPAEEKVKPPPKMLLSSTETQLRNTSSGVQPPPPLPPEPPVPIPIETVTLHLPMTVNKSIHLPISAQFPSISLFKRRLEVTKVCAKHNPEHTKKLQDQSFPIELTISNQPHQAVTSTLSA